MFSFEDIESLSCGMASLFNHCCRFVQGVVLQRGHETSNRGRQKLQLVLASLAEKVCTPKLFCTGLTNINALVRLLAEW